MDLDLKNIITLSEKFPRTEHEFIHGDVLKESLEFLHKAKHRVVGNLPYNISTQIIIKLINYFNGIEDMHFLVQKEVAHRICASNQSGDWGRLGVKLLRYLKRLFYLMFILNPLILNPKFNLHLSGSSLELIQ